MLRAPLLLSLVALPLLLLGGAGCQPGSTSPNDDEVGDGDGDSADGDSESDAAEANWIPARGIAITEVEANQGTRVPIGGVDGAWVDGSGRNTFLSSDRDTLIRVHYTVDAGWVPHEVMAKLTVTTPGSTEPFVFEQIETVESESTPTSLFRTFYFGLASEPGHTVPGAKYQVELFERDTEQVAGLPELANITPADQPELIGFESSPMEIKIVLVPIHYTGEGKDLRPDMSEDKVAILINSLYEQNPVQEVIYEIRDEVGYGQTLTNLGALLPIMAQTKQNDGAPANVYYHALINPGCAVVGCGSAGVAGIAQITNDNKNDSAMRVAATIFYNVDITKDTFVHEHGHNQGFFHVACPNAQAAGPDPTYPYANGKIGNWGFGIREYKLHNPTASHDYMTYCGNTWASDWTFDKAFNRIQTLTAWDYENGAADEGPAATSELLIGAIYPDGSEEWFTVAGDIDVEEIRPGEALEFGVGGQLIEQPAVVRTLSDGETEWVFAKVPQGVAVPELDMLAHRRDGMRRELDPTTVRVPVAGTKLLAPN